MEKKKVEVVSKVGGTVILSVPDLHFRREFRRKGAKVLVDKDILEEAIFNPGIEALFQSGALYIEDLAVKKELGLEPEDAKEPENIIVLNDAQIKRYLTVAPTHELKEIVEKLTPESKNELVEYAIANNISDYNKVKILKEATGIDVLNAIKLRHEEKE